jgi:hypothetical protein
MTSQEAKAATRQSLGLPPVEESKPTVPVEGHVCDFPLWSFSKQRSSERELHITYTYCISRRNFFGGKQLRVL